MVAKVIDIINEARKLANALPITDEAYDTEFEDGSVNLCQGLFLRAYKFIIDKKLIDYQYEFAFLTVPGQFLYETPVNFFRMASPELYFYDKCGNKHLIPYMPNTKQIEPNKDCHKGMPTSWSMETLPNTIQKQILFTPAPDRVYEIRGIAYESPKNLKACDYTICNDWGDEYIIEYISKCFKEHNGIATCQEEELAVKRALNKYLLGGRIDEDSNLSQNSLLSKLSSCLNQNII